MPRCLMPKKWKTAVANECGSWEYDGRRPSSPPCSKHAGSPQWEPPVTVLLHHHQPQHHHHPQQQHHHHAWGPSSPPAGATAPSPPPCCTGTAFHYLTEYAGSVKSEYPTPVVVDAQVPPSAAAMPSAREPQPVLTVLQYQRPRTYTSTGVALSLPPKKKDIYRPYSLDDHKPVKWPRPEEDISAAQAILDLSASTPVVVRAPLPLSLAPPPTLPLPLRPQQQPQQHPPALPPRQQQPVQPGPAVEPPQEQQPVQRPAPTCSAPAPCAPSATGKTVAYTYEAFFVSDGRSKRKSSAAAAAATAVDVGSGDECGGVPNGSPAAAAGTADFGGAATASPGRPSKYTCSECGKRYATSSNLSRHKQTHRSLDSQSAKRCNVCGKPYVSMPALAMHQLTHKLTHACAVCGKMFSRPWLLQGHLRSHTGEKPYGCAHCGKAFADRSNLRAHMQTHSGDKNFACPRCFKSFALKSYLNKHLESACLPANSAAATPSSPSSPPPQTHRQHAPQQAAPHVHDLQLQQRHHHLHESSTAEITNLNLLRPTVLHTA